MRTEFLPNIDAKIEYNSNGFTLTGRKPKELAELFKAIEPKISEKLERPFGSKLENILFLMAEEKFRGMMRIYLYDEWYVGQILKIDIERKTLLEVKFLDLARLESLETLRKDLINKYKNK